MQLVTANHAFLLTALQSAAIWAIVTLDSQVVTSARRARICPSDQRERGSARALSLVGCGPPALGQTAREATWQHCFALAPLAATLPVSVVTLDRLAQPVPPSSVYLVPRLIVDRGLDGQVNGPVVAASLRDCGPCPGQDATTIQSSAKPVSLHVKVGAASKTTLAERGGYTHARRAGCLLARQSQRRVKNHARRARWLHPCAPRQKPRSQSEVAAPMRAASKTTLAERGGYTHARREGCLLARQSRRRI